MRKETWTQEAERTEMTEVRIRSIMDTYGFRTCSISIRWRINFRFLKIWDCIIFVLIHFNSEWWNLAPKRSIKWWFPKLNEHHVPPDSIENRDSYFGCVISVSVGLNWHLRICPHHLIFKCQICFSCEHLPGIYTLLYPLFSILFAILLSTAYITQHRATYPAQVFFFFISFIQIRCVCWQFVFIPHILNLSHILLPFASSFLGGACWGSNSGPWAC